ncbi:glycoside hydrolase family 3 protein, partial [Oceanispirochaeta sp.]|uniref:glycoside hydrolase family 3 protein n=1 Tax=Oceanispirochaeta sp. TaxID=2035350 RepID=UPI00262C9A78
MMEENGISETVQISKIIQKEKISHSSDILKESDDNNTLKESDDKSTLKESDDNNTLKESDDDNTLTKTEKEVKIDSFIESMSLEEKIGQLFILAVRHTANGKPALTVDKTVRSFMEKYQPGGIILFSLNYQSPSQTRNFIMELQNLSPYPLFVTTDEEGGKVSRLGKSSLMDVLYLPPAGEIGMTRDILLAEDAAEVLALDMKELGFNMNMAPVADISIRGSLNPIGNRSYSSDPETAAAMTAATVRGCKKAGISPVVKHFPGHGNVTGDSHNGAVASISSREDFYNRDFIPFKKGIEAGTDFIMIGHIAAPSLTGTNTPASLSHQIQTVILREELGFKGLIITDAMDMGAIKKSYSPREAVLTAFLAGTDMILMPENIPEAQESLRNARSSGLLSQERLDESLRRILKLKLETGLFDKIQDSEED